MTDLAERMRVLEATDAEVGQLIDKSAQQVEAMRKGDIEIDSDTSVLLRTFLADDPHAAHLAIEKLRNTYTQSYRGDSAEHTGTPAEQLADNTPPQLDGGRPE
jgi:hypothetical protein